MPTPDARPAWWQALVSNPWTKLLSVALATFTWLYVQGEEVHETRIKAPIAWSLPPTLVATEPLPTSATLTVKGTRSAARKARGATVRLVVDVSELDAGDHTLEIAGLVPEGLPPSVELRAIAPGSVRFTLDEVATRSVKVRPVLVGDPADGYVITTTVAEPPVVEVRGPRSAVSLLREVQTRPVDVTGLDESGDHPALLDLPRGVEPSADVVTRIEVVSKVEQRRIEEVPVFVRGAPDWTATPATVTVLLEGPVARLGDVDADEVAAFVHLPDPADRPRYEAWFGPDEGARVEVMHEGGDDVKVLAIAPPSIVVQK